MNAHDQPLPSKSSRPAAEAAADECRTDPAALDGEASDNETGVLPAVNQAGLEQSTITEGPDDAQLSRLQRLRNWITPDPELDEDNRFEFSKEELTQRLTTDDPDKAAEILAEAREISERVVEGRSDGVERRAATLQSATAIVGSFSLAGAALLSTDVHGHIWQGVIGVLLVWITGNLGLCGWRATQAASGVIHPWATPSSQAILSRADQTLAEARTERSVDILRSAGWNARYARFKVTMLKRASRHLARATLGIPLLVAAVLAYALTYSPTASPHPHLAPKAAISSSAHPASQHAKVK